MKKTILLCAAVMTLSHLQAQTTFESATEAVRNMTVGWNLGNTLDANNGSRMTDIVRSETCWGQPVTRPELMTMMRDAGFGAIRVPVTWFPHMDDEGTVDAEWMARVHEVVDYVINAGLYCILNVHHDTGDGDTHWLHASMSVYNQQKNRYEKLWQQIATEFRDYDQRLLFEGYNEMLDKYNSWCFASFNTSNRYNAADAADAYQAINSFAQSFVNTVRATGGNNAQRNLIVNTYAASCGSGNWNSHLTDPLVNLNYPDDTATGHIAFEIHAYPNIEVLAEAKNEVDQIISRASAHLVAKGAPVIIGEWGTSNVDSGTGKTDYDTRRDDLFAFVDYMVQKTKENGIGTFFWMGLSDGIYRSEPAFNQPDLAERIAKAYHGDSFQGVYPTISGKSSILIFEGEKALGWGDGISINGSQFQTAGNGVQLELTYNVTAGGADIQFYYGDWSVKPTFNVGGVSYFGDYGPANTGSSQTNVITFSQDVYNTLCQKGLIVHGQGVTLTKVELVNPTVASVLTPNVDTRAVGRTFDLTGREVIRPQRGIYIRDGKKFVVR